MKIAHLILAHSNPEQLHRLINRLAHKNAHFYIHIDMKTDMKPFLLPHKRNDVFFIGPRKKVFWAGYSIVQATLNGFSQILGSGRKYDYINLLSGHDYPIKSTEYIHEFFSGNPGKIFMNFMSVENEWREAIPRFRKYYFADAQFPGKYSAERTINAVMPDRKLPYGLIAMGGSQWFSAHYDSVDFIMKYMKEKPGISKFFRRSWAADELIFQTILFNSPYRGKMVNNNLRYTDWSLGGASPKNLNLEDAKLLNDSDKLFARKFSFTPKNDLLDYLDKLTDKQL